MSSLMIHMTYWYLQFKTLLRDKIKHMFKKNTLKGERFTKVRKKCAPQFFLNFKKKVFSS